VVYTIVMTVYVSSQQEGDFRTIVDTLISSPLATRVSMDIFTGKRTNNVADFITIKKVMKHINTNPQKAALYVALRLATFPSRLSTWAQEMLKKTSLKSNGDNEIYYPMPGGGMGKVVFTRAKY
jgi:hypothetical protein